MSMKQKGFIFPLVLVILILITASTLNILTEQRLLVEHFDSRKATQTNLDDFRYLTEFSTPGVVNPWGNVVKNELALDGLYNLNHLVQTTASDDRVVNETQFLLFKRLLAVCGLKSEYASRIVTVLMSRKISNSGFTVLDLLAEVDIVGAEIPKALTCFRITSPLNRVNLRFSLPEHAAVLLSVSKQDAYNLINKIRRDEISNKNELLSARGSGSNLSNLKKQYDNLIISRSKSHVASYWTFEDKTFAYFEHKFEIGNGWSLLSNLILWKPELM